MRFEARLAWRHLISGGGQTLLTVSAVAVAVTVVIFIQGLIAAVQKGLLRQLVEPLPHVTIRPKEPLPQTLPDVTRQKATDTLPVSRRQGLVQQRREIQNWRELERQCAAFPSVKTVSPVVQGSAFLVRGAKRLSVGVTGSDPRQQEGITPLRDKILAGRWPEIGPQDIVIGFQLAADAGVSVGDRVRLQSAEGGVGVFTVAGIFDTGSEGSDRGQVFMTRGAAQGLFRSGQSVSVVLLKLRDPFRADEVADLIRASLGYETGSWSRDAASFLVALKAQDASSALISGFALLASAFSIASVLIVSVLQKSKQIGILKSMGARDRQIIRVFTLEGLGIAIAGSALGCGLSFLLLYFLNTITQPTRFGKEEKIFDIGYDPLIFGGAVLGAILSTLLAAFIPARRAARMNPVDIIRSG